MDTTFLHSDCDDAVARLVLAHGAGAPMDHPFMLFFAGELAKHRVQVIRFEFPYMASRRVDGKKRAPDREAVLRACWLDVVRHLGHEGLFIGGKSMGGRMATLVADEAKVHGLVCLGYPFHPPGRPEKLRVSHLKDLQTPALFVQGERDTFGNRGEVGTYALSHNIALRWLADGDHSFKPRKSSGRTEEGNWTEAVNAIAAFVVGRTA